MFPDRTTPILRALLLWSLYCLPIAAAAPPKDAQLVPENWEPPLIAPAYDRQDSGGVDRNSLVSDLRERNVRLPGFMKPQVYEGNRVYEFLLVPFLQHHVKQHAHLEPNQMVYVTLAEPLAVENPFDPIWVEGTLTLETVATDEGPAGYSMNNATAERYEY